VLGVFGRILSHTLYDLLNVTFTHIHTLLNV